MANPGIKRSTANQLAKEIRNSKLHLIHKEIMAEFLAKFFKERDPLFRDDIFINVASGTLENDPAIKNPLGLNQYGNKKNGV